MKLVSLRKKIDKIDSKVISLLNLRAELSKEIGKMKHKKGIDIYAPDRESEIYREIVRKNKGPLFDDTLKAVYREIMSGTLSLEGPIKIAYLGPAATFTHLASLEKFGSSVNYIDCTTIGDVFREVEKGRADYGVVPIENSIEGMVSHTLDMFIDSDLKICSEILLNISHNIMSKARKISNVKKIYSNPQVFGQCRNWIEKNIPRAELIEVSSTTRAAELVSKQKNSAAIGSLLAAEKYKLKILAKGIEDSKHNVTRFLIVGKTIKVAPTRKDKTSVLFSVRDKVGALHDILSPFKKYSINLTKIESRPSKLRAWEYYFFVDMEGHYQNETLKKALNRLKKECTYFKILGSYPTGK